MSQAFTDQVKGIFHQWLDTIHEINAKYAKPKIKMTKSVAFSLLMLRIYLIILVILLIYKFYTLTQGH